MLNIFVGLQAKDVAYDAAKAEARAASAALRAVEQGIALYAERREYLKLKDIAEASDVAGKVCNQSQQGVLLFASRTDASNAVLDVLTEQISPGLFSIHCTWWKVGFMLGGFSKAVIAHILAPHTLVCYHCSRLSC
jgi:hypothetical protein